MISPEKVHSINVRLVKENEEWKEKSSSMNQGGGQRGKGKGKSKPAEGGPTKATRGMPKGRVKIPSLRLSHEGCSPG